LLSGCASTQVTDQTQNTVMLPRPGLVYVYNFAVSPDEVTLQRGIGAEIRELAQKEPRTEQEIAVGHQVADALARHLVKEIQALGFPTYRTSAPLPAAGNNLAVKGQFISIDEGNRTERVLIGLGAGRTDVKTMVQVYEYQAGAPTVATRFSVDAKSGRQPGMAESMGAGAIAGHLATSAAVSAGAQVVGQKYSATVEADADRTAKDIAKQLKQYFVIQGWMRP
jgi:hypothetical protein